MAFDLKILNSALLQLEEEKGIPREKIIGAIEDALAAAYKKDYGKRGQIIRAKFDPATGKVDFYRVKIAVNEGMIKPEDEDEEDEGTQTPPDEHAEEDTRVRFNEEHHIWLSDAKKIKSGATVNDEVIFSLDTRDDYGRIAAQTAKQVIIQRLREAEKTSVLDEYTKRQGDIINGNVQRVERGNVFVDLGRITAILPREEQVPGEYYRQGERIKTLLVSCEESGRGIDMRLSRSHPQFLAKLFEIESPEIAGGTVEIVTIAREAGSRSKIAVTSHDPNIDPIGSLVGQRGIRVNTVINELGGEKIDIIEWSEDIEHFITQSLSPARVLRVSINEEERRAEVEVDTEQFSLAIGKGGQNVRLAAKLTGWKIDIIAPTGETVSETPEGGLASAPENEAVGTPGKEPTGETDVKHEGENSEETGVDEKDKAKTDGQEENAEEEGSTTAEEQEREESKEGK